MSVKVLNRMVLHLVPKIKISKISILDTRIGDSFWKFQSLIQLLCEDSHISFFSSFRNLYQVN